MLFPIIPPLIQTSLLGVVPFLKVMLYRPFSISSAIILPSAADVPVIFSYLNIGAASAITAPSVSAFIIPFSCCASYCFIRCPSASDVVTMQPTVFSSVYSSAVSIGVTLPCELTAMLIFLKFGILTLYAAAIGFIDILPSTKAPFHT